MKLKRAGLLTKLVVLAMLVFVASALLNLRTQIQGAQADQAAQEQTNADLRDAVDNSDDPERQKEIARSKLGLVAPGDQIIEFTD